MLRILVKKQLEEVFRGYFYNSKKNCMRPKWQIALYFVFYALIMVGLLGGMFTGLSFSLCGPFTAAGYGWLYFVMMGGIAAAIGIFASVFNCYSGLYLGKDNDLLFSLPIPLRIIIASRLINVYILGAMYSATVMIPTSVIYWITAGISAISVICHLLWYIMITVFVLMLSCIFGWIVAKLSQKIKNKGLISAAATLLFIGLYYYCYFKAGDLIQQVITHVDSYADKIKGAAYILYLFGRVGESDIIATLIMSAITAVVFTLVWRLMSRSFLKIATAEGKTAKIKYREKRYTQKTVFGALVSKELAKFTSSSGYMLNCGMGILLIPVGGIALLFKGKMLAEVIGNMFADKPGVLPIMICGALCTLAAMNDIATPSVSLEGKSLWIPQSLPVHAGKVLRAKACIQIILTGIPMLVACICALFVVDASVPVKILMVIVPLIQVVFSSLFDLILGLKMPLLNWTNELAPIKQSGAIVASMFGGWIFTMIMMVAYILVGYKLGAFTYLIICGVIYALAALIMLRWLDTKGAKEFEAL